MADGACNIVGISRSEEGAATKPAAVVQESISEITTETAGKIFIGLEVIQPGSICLGMDVNGKEVDASDNEKRAQTDLVQTPGKQFEVYFLDLPMRIIGNEKQKFPATHEIKVKWGNMVDGAPVWKGAETFSLVITGTAPEVKYDPVKDGD